MRDTGLIANELLWSVFMGLHWSEWLQHCISVFSFEKMCHRSRKSYAQEIWIEFVGPLFWFLEELCSVVIEVPNKRILRFQPLEKLCACP